MKISVAELAALVGGVASGDIQSVVTGAAGLDEATPSDVSFLKELRSSTKESFENSRAGVILVSRGVASGGKTVVEVEHPLAAFASVLQLLEKDKQVFPEGIHPSAVIHPTAKLGSQVKIGPFCVISEGATIGDNVILMAHVYIGPRSSVGNETLIYPQVVIREDVTVGRRCVLHASSVVGSDGYGFYWAQGRHNKIPQIGTVVIGDDVEIGSCTTIDRATTGTTVIRSGSKIDNLVQIAHNVDIGEHCLLVAQVGIAGSTKLGKGVVLAGQVGVADHVVIGDGSQVGAQSGIKEDVKPGSVLFGSPAQPIQDTLKQTLLIRRLPSLFKDVKEIKDRLT